MRVGKQKIGFFFILCYLSFNQLESQIHWSKPVTISGINNNAIDPQIIIDSFGNATAVWVENSVIKASIKSESLNWSEPTILSNSLKGAISPKLGMDSNGNVTALWLEGGIVYTAAHLINENFGSAIPLSSVLGGASSPELTVDSSGNAVAVWVKDGFIESSTRLFGSWESAVKLSSVNSDFPKVAISAKGLILAVWHSVVSGADVIISATKKLGESWNSPKSVFSGVAALNHNYPKITLDANGNATLVWFRFNKSFNSFQNVAVLTSSLTYQANSWTIPSMLSNLGLRDPSSLMLKVISDANGNNLALWTNSYDGQLFHLESSVRPFGSSWSSAVMPYISNLYTLAADVDATSFGNVLATYMTWDGNLLQIQFQESDIASPEANAWSVQEIISEGYSNGYPRCSFSDNGNISKAAAVWVHFNGSNNVIQAAIGTKERILPPTSLNVFQQAISFGVYTDFFNTLSWQPSPSADIQKYIIYRNGMYFASTGSTTFQITDHNALKNGSVTYGVAALDINHCQSVISTITFP